MQTTANNYDHNIVSNTWTQPIKKANTVPKKADVVIIGGGIIGIAAAWFLVNKGVSVIVCEKGHISAEQSGRNWGWVRQQGRDRRELPIMIDSSNIWKNIESEIGEDVGLVKGGCFFAAKNKEQLERYRAWLDVAKQYDLDTKIVQGEELEKLVTGSSDLWQGALYTPSDCRAEPHKATLAIAKAASKKGAIILTGCAVRGLDFSTGSVSGVITEAGMIETSTVLCAAGAWSSLFCGSLDIKVPQLNVRGTVARTAPCKKILNGNLFDDRIALRRREDGGYTVAHGFIVDHSITPSTFKNMFKFLPALAQDLTSVRLSVGSDFINELVAPKKWKPDEISPFEQMRVLNPTTNPRRLASIRKNLDKFFPVFKDVPIIESWAGMIDTTPDIVPIMEETDKIPGLYIATGFSGHGFGISLGAGKAMAGLILRDNLTHDLSPFRLNRFFDGSPITIDSASSA